MKRKFFEEDATGLKKDLLRHMELEKELLEEIDEVMKIEDPKYREVLLRSYNEIYANLLQSKAELAEKIGRKKKRK